MNARLNLSGSPLAAKSMKYLASASKVVIEGSTLPKSTENMVMLRASQINGCGFCTDIHTKDAAHDGETPVRINLVAAWRESKVFTDAERAALELTEQGTRMADAGGGVTDEAPWRSPGVGRPGVWPGPLPSSSGWAVSSWSCAASPVSSMT